MGQAFRKLFDTFFGNSEMRVRHIFLIISPICFCIYPFFLVFFWNFQLQFFLFFVFVVSCGLFPFLTNFVWQKFSDTIDDAVPLDMRPNSNVSISGFLCSPCNFLLIFPCSSLLCCNVYSGWIPMINSASHDPSLSYSNCHRLSCLAWMQLAKLPFSTNFTSAKFCLLFLLSVGCTSSTHLYKIHTIPTVVPPPTIILHFTLCINGSTYPFIVLWSYPFSCFTFLCILYLIHFKFLLSLAIHLIVLLCFLVN